MTIGSWSKNTAGSTQGGCLVEYFGRVASVGTGKMGELAPVFGLLFPVELAERVELDLPQRGLDSRLILGSVVNEDARHGHGEVGGRAHHTCNASRGLAFPVWPHDHVETGLGAVLQTKLAHLVGANARRLRCRSAPTSASSGIERFTPAQARAGPDFKSENSGPDG